MARARRTPVGFEQRLLVRTRAAGFARGDRLIIGFSGGRDSLAVAAAMRRVERVLGVKPMLVHVDHRLRPASGDDARRAEDLAAALGMPVRVRRLLEEPTTTHPGVGIEEAARRERYRVLFTEAAEMRARAVVTAHHQADQAETVLLHLLRGSGVHGAAAMGERSAGPMRDISHEMGIELWRPLLGEAPAAIETYVEELGLHPIADSSNLDRAFRRNALRHDILPMLEDQFPGATAALARFAGLAAEEDALLDQLANEMLRECVDPGGMLDAERLQSLPAALRRRVVRHWLQAMTGWDSFTAERTDAVVALTARRSRGKTIEIGAGWSVQLRRGMLSVTRKGEDG